MLSAQGVFWQMCLEPCEKRALAGISNAVAASIKEHSWRRARHKRVICSIKLCLQTFYCASPLWSEVGNVLGNAQNFNSDVSATLSWDFDKKTLGFHTTMSLCLQTLNAKDFSVFSVESHISHTCIQRGVETKTGGLLNGRRSVSVAATSCDWTIARVRERKYFMQSTEQRGRRKREDNAFVFLYS